jgi:hypothetical protein
MRSKYPFGPPSFNQTLTGRKALAWGPVEEARVLRGGSFNNTNQNARCAYRNNNNPNNRNNNNGFRLLVSHIFSSPAGNAWRLAACAEQRRRVGRPRQKKMARPRPRPSSALCGAGRANIE